MLTSLKVENFRCFKSFELQELGRINLLVGENNCGKTSILEAVNILSNHGKTDTLEEVIEERGERKHPKKTEGFSHFRRLDELYGAEHLFLNHNIEMGSKLSVNGILGGEVEKRLDLEIVEWNPEQKTPDNLTHFQASDDVVVQVLRCVNILDTNLDEFDKAIDAYHKYSRPIELVPSKAFETEKMMELFSKIMLNPEEDDLIESLQILDPNIERIAPEIKPRQRDIDHGFYVKLKNSKERIPIGSMGDGVWRMMGLAVALVNAKDGALLIDEIDTGLHYTTMEKMWRFIWKVARKLDVQVFATTHNSDCWMSLAEVADEEDTINNRITIHRIEKGASRSVMFTERQMAIAAEEGIEVR